MSDALSSALQFYAKERSSLSRYHGGMPIGFLCAIAQYESDGDMGSAGDASIGEAGYFQITSESPTRWGVDPALRYTPEGNIFLACLEYQVNAATIQKAYPQLMGVGSPDQWMFARLVFAIGRGGTDALINTSRPTSSGYAAFLNGLTPGDSKATNRAFAVAAQWNLGLQVFADPPGAPQQIPAPPGISYGLPAGVALASPYTGLFVALALAGAAYYFGA